MKTVVHLLRHGEVINPQGVLYGRAEGYSLSDRGQRQVELVAEKLLQHDIAYVVSSPLQRAQQTAAVVARSSRLTVHSDNDLTESPTLFDGLAIRGQQGALRNPRHWPKLWNPFTPSWGEPYKELAQRMFAAVSRAREQAQGREAVCVSHQLPIWILRRSLLRQKPWHDPRKRQCALASLTSLVFDHEKFVDLIYSEPAQSVTSKEI